MEYILTFLEISLIIGITGGLFGIFYRNCLKTEDLLLYPIYKHFFKPIIDKKNKVLTFLVYPIGYCVYCSSFWITLFIYWLFTNIMSIYLLGYTYKIWILGFIVAEAMQHIIVCLACRYIIYRHPDLDNQDNKNNENKRTTYTGFTKPPKS